MMGMETEKRPREPLSLLSDFNESALLSQAAKRVAAQFDFPAGKIQNAVKEFLRELDEGLAENGMQLNQIPTYVTAVPNGTEKGLYMAVDLGGTNFRVCSVLLGGDTSFAITQSKVKIPLELMRAQTAKELFQFLAKQIEAFLKMHHGEHYLCHLEKTKDGGGKGIEIFDMGFTFSFPVHQVGINKGYLIRWTKGFEIKDAIGQDVCALLQTEIDALKLPVRVAALVNDTVGTLMARGYTSPGKSGATLLGAIFGTGTNGAYVERLDRVVKMKNMHEGTDQYDGSTGLMIINTEWGSFDNKLTTLPNTPYDASMDADTPNPGVQMFEKRVSGMFLGEIFRRAVLTLLQDPIVLLFSRSGTMNQKSLLFKKWAVDSSFLSTVANDTTPDMDQTKEAIQRDLGIEDARTEDAAAVKLIADGVARRAARLAAVAIGAVVISSGRLLENDQLVDVGVDGSLVEYYPGFENYMREALRDIPEIGEAGEKRIQLGIAKDGSGVGAALIALIASRFR